MDAYGLLALSMLMVAAGALCAVGLYAVFGRPTSSAGKKRRKQVISGFALGGGIMLVPVLGAALLISINSVFFGMPSRLQSRTLDALLGCVALTVIAVTVNHWGKHVAGWVGYSVIPALFAASGGFYRGRPVPRTDALSFAGIAIMTVVASFRFTGDYTLNIVEKLALVMLVVAFAFSITVKRFELLFLLIGSSGLVVAWFYRLVANRVKRPRRAHA